MAVVMAAGMLPTAAFAAGTSDGGSNPYAPTGSFELHVAGTTAWNGGDSPLTIYKTENGTAQAATISTAVPFALLEDKGGDRLKIGYQDGGWTGGSQDGTGWVDKDSVLVNLPDLLPSIAYESDVSRQFSSRLTRFEYVIPGSYALAEQLAQLQREALSNGDTLVVRQSGQTVCVSRAKGDPAQLHSYSPDGVTYQKYNRWTEYNVEDDSLSDLSYDLPFAVNRAYSVDPSVTLTKFCPQSIKRAPSRVSASDPTGDVGAYNPGSPGGKKPSTSNVSWSTDPERTFLRFTLLEFPQGVVTDLNTNDYSTWHVVGTPLNVVWSKGWSADECRSDVTWYNSQAMSYNGMGANAAQLMAGSSVAQGVYSYDATAGHNKRWVTTADEFQSATGIIDQQKEQMFHCNSGSWSSGWTDGDYTSMWGTDAESVTPGNLYKVYKASGITGTVVAKEVKAAPGYVIDQSTQTQTVTVNPMDTQTLVFLNEPLCSLTLTKSDYDKPSNLGVTITKRGNAEVLASNLITSISYSFSLNAIPTQAGEYVTDVYLDFGKVPVGFQSVSNPTLTVTVSGTAANGYQLINRADVGGKYQGTWQTAQATWVTLIRKLTPTVVPKLPKTGY